MFSCFSHIPCSHLLTCELFKNVSGHWTTFCAIHSFLLVILQFFSLGNMEGQSHRNSLTSLDAYNLSQLAENYPYQHYIVMGGRNESRYVPLTLPQWNQCQPMSHNYVKFLAENGASEIQGEISYNNSCMTSSFNPVDSYPDIDDQKVELSVCMLDSQIWSIEKINLILGSV